MSTVDAADAHAFAMFSAGWRAAYRTGWTDAMGSPPIVGEYYADPPEVDEPPTPEQFYLAVPDPAERECSLGKVIGLFTYETQALQARIRTADVEVARLIEQGVALRRLMEQRAKMLRAQAAPKEKTS